MNTFFEYGSIDDGVFGICDSQLITNVCCNIRDRCIELNLSSGTYNTISFSHNLFPDDKRFATYCQAFIKLYLAARSGEHSLEELRNMNNILNV